jgi:uncharacterized repeat protein (TIGR01451 family)
MLNGTRFGSWKKLIHHSMRFGNRPSYRHIPAPRPSVEVLENRLLMSVLYDESISGDLSNSQVSPTPVTLALGTNSVKGTVGTGDNQDWITVHVPTGMALSMLVLQTYVSSDAQGFIGVQSGTSFVGNAFSASSYLGYAHYGTGATNGSLPPTNLVGADLLPLMGNTSLAAGSQGFTPPLASGDYTFLIQQLGSPTTYQFDFDTTSVGTPDLTIAKSHAGIFQQGDLGDQYKIVVTNAGTAASTGTVTVTDTLPAGLLATSADNATVNGWSVTFNGQNITATRSDALAVNASYGDLVIKVDVAQNAPANVVNTASAAGGGETNTTNDSSDDSTNITQLPDLTISATQNGSFTQGDTADTYTITVGNSGSAPTSGLVTVTDTLPSGLTPTAADNVSNNGWTLSFSGQTITATRSDSLAAGATYGDLVITVAVDFAAPGSVTNTASVAGTDRNLANNSVSVPTTILPFTGPNQPPVNTLPAAFTGTEDTAQVLTGISVADPDAGSASEQITFTVDSGSLTVATGVTGGITAVQVSGNGTSSIVIMAPLAAINATLADPAGLTYAPAANINGNVTLTMTTSDQGHTGAGGAQQDSDTSTITLAAVNDPPVNTVPSTATTLADTPMALTGISITDVDAGASLVTAVLSLSSGTLALSTSVPGGVSAGEVTGNGTAVVMLFSTFAKIDATLAAGNGVVFTPQGGFSGVATLTVVSNDLGNTGSGGPQSATSTEAISVTPVVDHFTVALPANAVAGVSFGVTVTARDQAGNAVNNFAGSANLITTSLLANLPAQVTFSGGVANFNATLNTAGSQQIIAIDAALPTVTGQASLVVGAGAAAGLRYDQAPVATLAGAPFRTPFSVAVVDAFGNVVTTDNTDVITVRLQTRPAGAALGGTTSVSAVRGVAAFPNLQVTAAGIGMTLQARTPSLPVTVSDPFTVVAIAGFTVTTTQTTLTAGNTFSVTVQAVDKTGQVVTGYPGVIHFTSNDPQAVLPADTALTQGQGTFNVTFKTAGSRTVSVTDRTRPSLAGALKKAVTVTPATVSALTIGGITGSVTFNQKQMVTISAVDQFGNVNPTYRGAITFTSTDPTAVLPLAAVSFSPTDAGKHIVSLTFKTPGLRSVRVTDGTVSGTQANIAVAGATPTVLSQGADLVVIGTAGNDAIDVLPSNAAGTQLEVRVGGVSQGTAFAPTGHLLVYGMAGDDVIRLLPGTGAFAGAKIAIRSVIDGGAGNNVIDASGSNADAILIGGTGVNRLTGGSGSNILISGLGIATLHGGPGDDLLIGGSTAFDANLTALVQLMDEFGNGTPLLTRFQHLTGTVPGGANAPFLLNSSTVHKGSAADVLVGNAGHDWFFASAIAPDQAQDIRSGDLLTLL